MEFVFQQGTLALAQFAAWPLMFALIAAPALVFVMRETYPKVCAGRAAARMTVRVSIACGLSRGRGRLHPDIQRSCASHGARGNGRGNPELPSYGQIALAARQAECDFLRVFYVTLNSPPCPPPEAPADLIGGSGHGPTECLLGALVLPTPGHEQLPDHG